MSFLDHLAPTEEAKMIQAAAERFSAAVEDAAVRGSDGFDPIRWVAMADLGWHGVLAEEASGGLDLGPSEMAILAKAIGSARLPEPFIPSSVTALTALRTAGNTDLISQAVSGSAILAPVGFGPSRSNASPLQAKPTDDGVVLSGTVPLCELGPMTTDLVIYADAPSPVLIHLPRTSKGLEISAYRSIDGRHLAKVQLHDCTVTSVEILALGSTATQAAAKASALAIAALCADAVGTMDRAIALTGTYLNGRQQFGRPLAGFQALRHRFADISVECELARSMASLAAYGAGRNDDTTHLSDLARARVCRAAKCVGQAVIQLHGGMGMTDEMAIGHYFRRLIFIQAMLGQEAGALRDCSASLAGEINALTAQQARQ